MFVFKNPSALNNPRIQKYSRGKSAECQTHFCEPSCFIGILGLPNAGWLSDPNLFVSLVLCGCHSLFASLILSNNFLLGPSTQICLKNCNPIKEEVAAECLLSSLITVLQIHRTTHKFNDSEEGLTGFTIQSYSWLRFIIAKQYKAKSAKGKSAWDEIQRKQA